MNKEEFVIKRIGIIHSSFKTPAETPIQPVFSRAMGHVYIYKKYMKGLKDIDGFSHIILIYYFHKGRRCPLLVKPYLDRTLRGVFATRSPHRPNKIGISVVRLLKRNGNVLEVEGLDVIDGTPLIDIKPYVLPFEKTEKIRIGWLEEKLK
jgi:tRNA-Thr(GGU) m(6)t(6)A37 methyltransferase TsaA